MILPLTPFQCSVCGISWDGPCHLFQEPMLLLCGKEGMPVGGSGHGLQAALVMIAIEDKTSLVKGHGAPWTDPSSTSTISQTAFHHTGSDVHPLHLSLPFPTSLWLFHSFNPIIVRGFCSQRVRQKQFNSVRTGLAGSCPGDCPTTVYPLSCTSTLYFSVTHKLCPALKEE